jgi:hypothetical protein
MEKGVKKKPELSWRLVFTKKAHKVATEFGVKSDVEGCTLYSGQYPVRGDDLILKTEKGTVIFKVKRLQYDFTEEYKTVIYLLLGIRDSFDYLIIE